MKQYFSKGSRVFFNVSPRLEDGRGRNRNLGSDHAQTDGRGAIDSLGLIPGV